MGLFKALFDSNVSPCSNWTATFGWKGERMFITLYGRTSQPAEFEFVNELRKRRPEWDISQVKLIEIRKE